MSKLVICWLVSLISLILPVQAITLGAAQPDKYLPLLASKRVALVVNQTSMVGDEHLVDYLLYKDVNVVSVMAPEHGFRGDAGAGETIKDGIDEKTGLPILSLYGKTKKPTVAMLEGVDTLVFDIQDVGARFYTYISTLHYVMEAAAEQGKQVVILDRPNPNGAFVDGPVREEAFASFVGMDPIPLLHGMTIGELAKMIKGEGWINNAASLVLSIIPMAGYERTMAYSLPVAPSPNLPNDKAIQLYPSLCLFEGTVVSVGRGTPFPFQVVGHNEVALGTFSFTPVSMPQSAPSPKLQDQRLLGKDLRNSEVKGFDLGLLIAVHEQFEAEDKSLINRPDFFDKLSGTDTLRKAIVAGKSEAEIRAQWKPALTTFIKQRKPYLLYPDTAH